MRWTKTVITCGLVLGAAALHAAFAGNDEDAAFDSPAVKELGARFDELKLDDQVAMVQHVRRSLTAKLLAPPDDAWKGFETLKGRSDAGLARILNRGPFDGIVTPRGGGAYWSFTKRSNSYDQWPQLELQQWMFSTGFYGSNSGLVVQLETADLLSVSESSLTPDLLAAPEDVYSKARANRRDRPKAEPGAVFAVRAVMWDECDVLAALQVVSKDQYGVTIAWRLLKTLDTPTRKR
jgi:hypothetical protein